MGPLGNPALLIVATSCFSFPDPLISNFFLDDEKLPDGSLALLNPWIICTPASPAGTCHWDSSV